jgi:hypothetical protein
VKSAASGLRPKKMLQKCYSNNKTALNEVIKRKKITLRFFLFYHFFVSGKRLAVKNFNVAEMLFKQ